LASNQVITDTLNVRAADGTEKVITVNIIGNDDWTLINGTAGADTLRGGFGDDAIYGLAGDDTIDAGAGNDVVYGGEGKDQIVGNFGNDTLYGGAGDDNLTDDQGTNLLDGGDGNDNLRSESLTVNATLLGGAGSDSLRATGKVVVADGGDGNDNINVQGNLYQNGSTSYVVNASANVSGGAGNDYVYVESVRAAVLSGGAGDDTLDNHIYVWNYRNTDGSQRVDKTATVDGGDGNDKVTVDGYNYVGYGKTTVSLLGGAGNDRLTATDREAGSPNNPSKYYGIAHATLDGGVGDDMLSAGGVVDLTMTGGSGADSFVLTAQQYRTQLEGTRSFTVESGGTEVIATHATVITDFEVGVGRDILDVSELLRNASTGFDGSNPFSSGYLTLEQSGADTLVKFDADGLGTDKSAVAVAVLQNVTATNLVADNFNPNYPLPLNDFYNSY
jgi:Ca2+-binding RTX toxin-like protein